MAWDSGQIDVTKARADARSGLIQSPWISRGAHVGASFLEPEMRTWTPLAGSPDADLLPDRHTLVSRARDIDRNNGVARGGIQTIVDNVVGTGLRLQPRPDYLALGKSKEWASDWAKQVGSLWQQWFWTTACHAGDTMTGDQLTQLALRSELMNGEALALPMWIGDRGDGFSTKVQMVEPDRLSNPNFELDTRDRRGGIELGQFGEPVAYWVKKTHPGDWLVGGFVSPIFGDWERIPRRTPFGRLRVLHSFDRTERSGQSRGKPILSAVLAQFKQLDRYAGAELMAAVVNAMVAGIITTPLPHDDIVDLFKNDSAGYLAARNDSAVKLQAGSLLPLFPGDDIKPFMPQRPAAAFGAFVENIFRIIAVGLDMPYELLLKDFSKTSYASARSSMLEAWRSFNRRRDSLGTQWGDPLYWLFLEEVVNDGRIEAADFYDKRAAYQRCRWVGPGRGWVDPVKEAQAAQIRIDGMLSTLEYECAEQGLDWEEVIDQRALEQQRITELGLVQIVTGRATVVPDDQAQVDGAGPGADGNPSDQSGTTTTPTATPTK